MSSPYTLADTLTEIRAFARAELVGHHAELDALAEAPLPLYETFAFITRRDAHLSPATRAFLAMAERRVQALARRFEADAGGG